MADSIAEPQFAGPSDATTLWASIWRAGFIIDLVYGTAATLRIIPRSSLLLECEQAGAPPPALTEDQLAGVRLHRTELARMVREQQAEDEAMGEFLQTADGSRWLGELFAAPSVAAQGDGGDAIADIPADLELAVIELPGRRPGGRPLVARASRWTAFADRIAEHNHMRAEIAAKEAAEERERVKRREGERAKAAKRAGAGADGKGERRLLP